MCGIAGVIRYGKTVITEPMIAMLLTGNEHRGNDATGIALQQEDGQVDVLKHDVPAWKFVSEREYIEFIKKNLKPTTQAVLCHTRGASQGNPRDNNNNHPMFNGKSAVIHNGSIKNDTLLFENMHLDRRAATDSDIIRAILDKHGITSDAIKELNRMNGSMASAAFHPEYPGKVLIMRSGAPLMYSTTEDLFIFASEKNTIHRAMRPIVMRFGVPAQIHDPKLAFAPFPDHTAWIMGPHGQEFHGPCKTLEGIYVEPWRRTYEEYATRQSRWDSTKSSDLARTHYRGGRVITILPENNRMKAAWCDKCQREWIIPKDGVFDQYSCDSKNKAKPGCGGTLMTMPIKEKAN